MNIVVTGGLGFIGSHLTSQLLRDPDNTVHVVDNLMSNVLPLDEIVEQITVGQRGRLELHLKSVLDFEPEDPIDEIYHLASVVGPAAVIEHAGHLAERILADTVFVVGLAETFGATLANISTSEVYGGGNKGYCDELAPRIIRPKASARLEYAVGKLTGEIAIENLCRTQSLRAVTIRPFNVCGVRQQGVGGFVLPRFIGQSLLNKPLTVFGDGNQVRAFTDVRDVVDGIIIATRKGMSGTAYNVGNPGNRTTIKELAELVLDITGSQKGIQFLDPKSIYGPEYEEADDKYPNAERLMRLEWTPQYTLCDTIRSVWEAMQKLPTELIARFAGIRDNSWQPCASLMASN